MFTGVVDEATVSLWSAAARDDDQSDSSKVARMQLRAEALKAETKSLLRFYFILLFCYLCFILRTHDPK